MGWGFEEGADLCVEVGEEGKYGAGGDCGIDAVASGDDCEPRREELGVGLGGAEF